MKKKIGSSARFILTIGMIVALLITNIISSSIVVLAGEQVKIQPMTTSLI